MTAHFAEMLSKDDQDDYDAAFGVHDHHRVGRGFQETPKTAATLQ